MRPTKLVVIVVASTMTLVALKAADGVADSKLTLKPYLLDKCFISDKDFAEHAVEFEYEGRHIKLCCEDCEADFEKDPKFYLTKLDRLEKEAVAKQKLKIISVAEFEKLRASTNNVVLDVRTAKEFAVGHVPKAVHLDVGASDFEKKAAALDKAKTYLILCASGDRSAQVSKILETLGFKTLYALEGGFAAWEKAGHPVER